jgi:prevent-host-death family protein
MTIIVIIKGGKMPTAPVSELKARLSEYLQKVRGGAEVLITDRGKPVAKLVPISRSKKWRDSFVKMEKRGLIKLGSGRLSKGFWALRRPEDPEGLVLQALLEERAEGR